MMREEAGEWTRVQSLRGLPSCGGFFSYRYAGCCCNDNSCSSIVKVFAKLPRTVASSHIDIDTNSCYSIVKIFAFLLSICE